MYLSRIQLRFKNLRPEMLEKWNSARPYASHQWLWQLFPEQESRQFLFREEPNGGFFMLSAIPPLPQHSLFLIETKPFNPQLMKGLELDFQLRANPVITRNGKRSDVMMNAKYQAKANGVAQERWWKLQQQAAQAWLEKQGHQHGFRLLESEPDDFAQWAGTEYSEIQAHCGCVQAYQQHRCVRTDQEKPIAFSSVDFSGTLCITDALLFEQALFSGLGKSKALGCGMLMVKRKR
ncbi:MAG: type I-E CRISPR-associated protein Cas6/Cse3/CasE [Klebsiella grimontii]|uniref:type I-E CRISPR-associated protein Cas6/Cse3/CasE n=1 Tax=Klebsiella grimontii TaxID=2058152 RepID=UPI001CCACC94|nr:type I-E CRISPR-associated protein Cas6/Cse3/CasE [Klebsiella grimontii]MDU1517236.1 type I-E CRISPR-associated protein Cas6/Cse3/CasE [Klebsiella michiganensis]MBZ6728455.1 type I-E CRISPR-associated protein Cas6/Cse3/CasE [Klebsiella grimontii]MBZ7381813.1 type I-E CRISPR-associated protein Cas6/Cse3/CasE [Klebsiella grimontii]MDU1614019.1 type I-E CRISPR-associated protein Cas6/Cse3/CasE [Klebsiella michiganensis]MDU7346294.1 type I-E CRISPR-associated protein Cas6/Cse3/CasE [Klebsiella 